MQIPYSPAAVKLNALVGMPVHIFAHHATENGRLGFFSMPAFTFVKAFIFGGKGMVTLVIGGGGSGKSAFAESIAQKYSGATAYIATMEPYGEEGAKRIERHRKMRADKGFHTIEQYSFINEKTAENYENVLLECVSNLVANHIFTENDGNVVENVADGIDEMIKSVKNAVIVTNDIFADGCDYDDTTRDYIAKLGAVNCRLAQLADEVYEVVVGIPIKIK